MFRMVKGSSKKQAFDFHISSETGQKELKRWQVIQSFKDIYRE